MVVTLVSKSVIRRFSHKAIKILDALLGPGAALLALERKKRENGIQLKEEKCWGLSCVLKHVFGVHTAAFGHQKVISQARVTAGNSTEQLSSL